MRAAAQACGASPKTKARLPVRYVASTEREYPGRREASASTCGASTPAAAATSRRKSPVAPTPIGTVRTTGWPKVRRSHSHAVSASSGA